jgi:tRNA-dihydrouridine synthase 4
MAERLNTIEWLSTTECSLILNARRKTIDFIKTGENAGVDFITIHGRTCSTPSSQPVNLEVIRLLTSQTTAPTLSNGGIFALSDVYSHADMADVEGVISAGGLL